MNKPRMDWLRIIARRPYFKTNSSSLKWLAANGFATVDKHIYTITKKGREALGEMWAASAPVETEVQP